MNRRGFLGLLAGSFAAIPVVGLKDFLPVGVTRNGVRPIGEFPAHKIRWTKSVPVVDQACRVSRGFLDVEHDCACGWRAGGMYVTIIVTENEFDKNRRTPDGLKNLLEVKHKNALLKLEDLWNTAKYEPFIAHETCPKIVGAWRRSA